MLGSVELSVVLMLLLVAARDAGGPARGVPRAAGALWAVVALPSLAQLARPGLEQALRCDPDAIWRRHEGWRLVTAVVVQDGGAAGTAFNLTALALAAALAVRAVGTTQAIATFWIAGAGLDLAEAGFGVTTAGTSGAVFALLGSVAARSALRRLGASQLRAAGALAAGGLLWAGGDVHGAAILAGGLLGVAAALPLQMRLTGGPRRGRSAPAAQATCALRRAIGLAPLVLERQLAAAARGEHALRVRVPPP